MPSPTAGREDEGMEGSVQECTDSSNSSSIVLECFLSFRRSVARGCIFVGPCAFLSRDEAGKGSIGVYCYCS